MDQTLAALPPTFVDFKPQGAQGVIAKISYTHDGLIDEIIRNPHASQGQLAALFGFTAGWISQVIASDIFQARLAERKDEIIDPVIKATVEERLKGLVLQSIEKLKQKLESPVATDDLALGILNSASKALGYGAKAAPTINQNFVVQIPGKASSSEEWAARMKENSADGRAAVPLPDMKPRRDPPVIDALIVTERPGGASDAVVPTQILADKLLAELVNG